MSNDLAKALLLLKIPESVQREQMRHDPKFKPQIERYFRKLEASFQRQPKPGKPD